MSRRMVLRTGLAWGALQVLPMPLSAQPAKGLERTLRDLGNGAPVRRGRVTLETPVLAENGNHIELKVRVDSPMTATDFVRDIHVLSEKNPVTTIAAFHLGPRAGRAEVATNIRLAGSQQVMAVARLSNGELWSAGVEIIVTVAACLEGN